MKHCALLSLLLALGCVHVYGAPVEPGALEQGSCEDAQAKFTAELALTKINQDREDGYILSLHRLSNVHMKTHQETGVVFYLTMDVVETNCSVLSRKDWKTCEARRTENTPVYGQCKVTIYINRPHRVVRLYQYNCAIRPVPSARVHRLCPDCPGPIDTESPQVQKALTDSLEKFNKESKLNKRFALLKVARATAGMAMSMYYNVEYSIQETTCSKSAEADNCPLMGCKLAHKGFCKASLWNSPTGESETSVDCEIFEPEAAGRETDHTHNDTATHNHDHDDAHAADDTQTQVQTKGHAQHDHHPEGMVRMLPSMDMPMTLPSFPDAPVAGPEVGVTLPLKPDPQIPGATEPIIGPTPTSISAQCPPPAAGETLVEKLFAEDPLFNITGSVPVSMLADNVSK
uniref:fetuin-B-like n=1 Tax=Semicossyphus pulcher TaxID=241346 RepID=UPI0037E779F3